MLDTAENCDLHATELNAVFNECTGSSADIQCTTVTLPDGLTANVLTVAPPKDPDCDTVALGLNRAVLAYTRDTEDGTAACAAGGLIQDGGDAASCASMLPPRRAACATQERADFARAHVTA